MKKVRITLIVAMITMLIGCGNREESGATMLSSTEITTTNEETFTSEEELSETEITTELITEVVTEETELVELVSAEEFMEFYELTEEQVPLEYVEAFIDEYDITEEQLGIGKIKELLMFSYQSGEVFGYNINEIFGGSKNDEPLVDYINKVEVIQFEFEIYEGEYYYVEYMVIDLKEAKIYFSPAETDDYRTCELSADLTLEDIESIRKELPTHIDDSKEYPYSNKLGEYLLEIHMTASDDTTKSFYGSEAYQEPFPGFDEYWKDLYKKYFGKEYESKPFIY